MLERSEEQFPELPMQWRDHATKLTRDLEKGRMAPFIDW